MLFFDECYDEENYSMQSALRAAGAADLLLVVGTSGATNLPMQIGELCWRRGAALVDVNPEENPFAELAQRSRRGFFARGGAGERLPAIVEALWPSRIHLFMSSWSLNAMAASFLVSWAAGGERWLGWAGLAMLILSFLAAAVMTAKAREIRLGDE